MNKSILEIELAESITSAIVGELWEKANKILESNPDSPIVVNASNLTFIDISGVAFLSDLQTRFRSPGAEISIIGLNPSLAELVPPAPAESAPTLSIEKPAFLSMWGMSPRICSSMSARWLVLLKSVYWFLNWGSVVGKM